MKRKTVNMSGSTRTRRKRPLLSLRNLPHLQQKQSLRNRSKKNLHQQRQQIHPDAERDQRLSQSRSQNLPGERGWADLTGTISSSR